MCFLHIIFNVNISTAIYVPVTPSIFLAVLVEMYSPSFEDCIVLHLALILYCITILYNYILKLFLRKINTIFHKIGSS